MSTPEQAPVALPGAPAPVSADVAKAPGTGSDAAAPIDPALAQKQKLDCAMQLIRSVALDFNNALTSILGHTSLLLSRTEAQSPQRSSLLEIEKSAQRAAEVAADLAAFSRQEKDARGLARGNLNEVLRRAVDVFRERRADISWRVDCEARLYTATFDESKVQQAFVKILENAVEALSGAGRITASTRNVEVAARRREGQIELEPGSYVCVEITDSGAGIPVETLPRIFEPFFSTKRSAKHRGLGLAWVYGIVTNHGGRVGVASELNKGTSVSVFLPAQKKFIQETDVSEADLRGTATILMVDDEDLILTMGETVLSAFGYRVLTADNGRRALDILTERMNEVDLLITDLVMPQMSGRELIEHIREIAPNVKILCSSGFVRPVSSEENDNYLQKPFASHDLLRKVKQVLTGKQG